MSSREGKGPDEGARLRALASYEVLDTPPEPELDELTRSAARICGTPVALLSLVDRERNFFKSHFGIGWTEAPRDGSFCAEAICGEEVLEVPDTALDHRFAEHPLVVAEQPLRFYAGAPLLAAIGTLCVIDWIPRTLAPIQRDGLAALARQVMSILDRRRSGIAFRKARQALDQEMRDHLRSLASSLATLRDSPANLIAACSNADAAAQLLDDAVDLLGGPGEMVLQRRPMDLGLACGALAADFQDPAQGRRTLFSASGDCTGFWDEDRLTHSLSVLIERALGGAHGLPVLIRVDASESAVALELRTRSILPRSAGADLRLAVARAAIAAHGGWLEERRDGGGVTLAVSLPRSGDTKATSPSPGRNAG